MLIVTTAFLPACAATPTSTDPAALASPAPVMPAQVVTTLIPREYAIGRMKAEGFPDDFVKLVDSRFDEDELDALIDLNILGFVKRADYTGHLSPRAVRKVHEFLRKHRRALARAEKSYGVSPEVIASLLWVETKYGNVTGRHSVAGVFFSLLQAEHPDVESRALQTLATKVPEVTPEFRIKVRERTQSKARWALGELKALSEVHKRKALNARTLKGSFAGAFGLPQFVPSSYAQWSRSSRGEKLNANLFRMDDAIHSVAYYLKSNGWKPADSASHQAALFHYNRSTGYVDVILRIAACSRPASSESRLPASNPGCP